MILIQYFDEKGIQLIVHLGNAGSSLAPYQPTPIDWEALRREAWERQRVLVIGLDDPRLDAYTRQVLANAAGRLFGLPVTLADVTA